MKVLIGEISSYKAIVIARYFRRMYPDVELLAYDNKPMISSIHTRYIRHCKRLPFKSLDNYIFELANYVHRNEIDVLIPVHSDYIGAILQKKELFGCALDWLGEYDDYIRLHEKNQLMEIASKLGIRIPINYKTIADAQIPFVIKPTNLSSAKGVRYFHTDEEKKQLNSLPEETICQEYIEGQGCGYEVYCRNGKIMVEYGHLRLAEWPISGGSSVLREGYIHLDMRMIAEKILSVVPWTGFAMFEFKITSDGDLVLIEVNPRIWGSINQALEDGCPLFDPIIGGHTSWNLNSTNSQFSVRTSLIPQVWLAMVRYAFHGQRARVWDWMKHWNITKKDVSLWIDPLGMISMLIRKVL